MKRPRALLAFPLLFALAGCVTDGTGSVAGGECKVFEAPKYAVKGARPYDQDWIDSTIEGGVGACKWERPAPRPAALDAVPAAPKKVAKVPLPKKKPLWIRMLRFTAPASPKVPEAPPTLTPLPVEPDAPAPRSAIDELLSPAPAK